MRILLTGATGFVGGHAAQRLAAAGHELRILTRETSDLSGLDGLAYTRVVADLRGPGLEAACVETDVVVHIGGITKARHAREFDAVNAAGTARLAAAAADAGVARFVYVSSLAALGPADRPEPPDTAPHPITDYGRSKQEGETAALAAAQQGPGSMAVQVLRPPAVYGPRDTGLLPFFRMARRRFITRFGRGRNRVSMIYGPDLAEAVASLVEGPVGPSPYFHAADAEGPYTWRELISALGGAFERSLLQVPVPPTVFDVVSRVSVFGARVSGMQPVLDRSRFTEMKQTAWVCDSEALTAHTGWEPRTGLGEGLRETVDWYRRHGWI